MEKLISSLILLGFSIFTPQQPTAVGPVFVAQKAPQEQILAEKRMNLATRHKDPWVNGVFADNILLNLHYFHASLGETGKVGRPSKMEGRVSFKEIEDFKDAQGKIDWDKVRAPFDFTLTLNSGQTFAYHKNLLPEFRGENVIIGESRFWYDEGYKSDGYLVADGVCHLASLFNWVAQSAGLTVLSRVNHDFAPVSEIPREFGTSILYAPDGGRNSANQNLYITNNLPEPVVFKISVNNGIVEIQITSTGSVALKHDGKTS